MEKAIKNKNIENKKKIHAYEQSHYFICWYNERSKKWHLKPRNSDASVKQHLSKLVADKNAHNIRVLRECDLSIFVSENGRNITMREHLFGSAYQIDHDEYLKNNFGEAN